MAGGRTARKRPANAPRCGPGDRLRGPWYILWGARVLGIGPLCGLALAVALLIGACNARFAETDVPGAVDVTLDEGGYSVLYEYPDYRAAPVVEFVLTALATGDEITFVPPGHAESHTVLTRKTVVLYDIEIAGAGVYRLEVWYAPGERPADVRLAIGRGPGERMVRFLAIVGVVVAGGGVWVLIVIALSRYFHPRRQ